LFWLVKDFCVFIIILKFLLYQFILDLCCCGNIYPDIKKILYMFFNGDYFQDDFSIELLWFGVKESY